MPGSRERAEVVAPAATATVVVVVGGAGVGKRNGIVGRARTEDFIKDHEASGEMWFFGDYEAEEVLYMMEVVRKPMMK